MKKLIGVVSVIAVLAFLGLQVDFYQPDGQAAKSSLRATVTPFAAGRCSVEISAQGGSRCPTVPGVLWKSFFAALEEADLNWLDDLACEDEMILRLGDDLNLALSFARGLTMRSGRRAFLVRDSRGGQTQGVWMRLKDGFALYVSDPSKGRDHLVVSGGDGFYLSEIDPSCLSSFCRILPLDAQHPLPLAEGVEPERASDGSVYVDLMMALDRPAVGFALSQNLEPVDFAELVVQRTNLVVDNSGLSDRFLFRLVEVQILDGDLGKRPREVLAAVNMRGAVGEISLDLVRARRDEVNADVAIVLLGGTETGEAGIANALHGADPALIADQAFAVCAAPSVFFGTTLAHELGHLMGAGHSDLQPVQPGPQLFDFSSGFYGSGYATVMAYPDETHPLRLPCYSSPLRVFAGEPVGDDHHDNAQTLARTFAFVSNFRTVPAEEAALGLRAKSFTVPQVADHEQSAEVAEEGEVKESDAKETEVSSSETSADQTKESGTNHRPSRRIVHSSISNASIADRSSAILNGDRVQAAGALGPGVILNLEADRLVREFKTLHPEALEVHEAELPEGEFVVQHPTGDITLPPGADETVQRSEFACRTDPETGVLKGSLKLNYTDAEGEKQAEVDVFGLIINGEAAGITILEGDVLSLVTIAPEENPPEEAPSEEVENR